MSLTYFKKLVLYTLIVLVLSVGYFIYAYTVYPASSQRETFLSEIGEGFGVLGVWGLIFIYGRTLLKLFMGKGPLAKRLVPDYTAPTTVSLFQGLLNFLNKTHVYVGVATVAVILLHIVLTGGLTNNLFFLAILVLIIWQGLFGLFISWKYSPKELKKFAFMVHAQFLTGVIIGIFTLFGHLLVDK